MVDIDKVVRLYVFAIPFLSVSQLCVSRRHVMYAGSSCLSGTVVHTRIHDLKVSSNSVLQRTDICIVVYYEDAKAWLENSDMMFDVIIMDICDPIEAGPGIALYEMEFYKFAITKLTPGGILVTQSGVGSVLNTTECFTVIHQTLKRAFDNVVPFTADVPSFGFNWGWNLAFNNNAAVADKAKEKGCSKASDYFTETTVKEIDDAIAERITLSNDESSLRFMDGISYRGVMGVPKPVRKALAEEERFISKDNHVYMY